MPTIRFLGTARVQCRGRCWRAGRDNQAHCSDLTLGGSSANLQTMPMLSNPRHEAFCHAFVTSGNASAAYRESGGNGRNADVIANQSTRTNGFAERIAELKAAQTPATRLWTARSSPNRRVSLAQMFQTEEPGLSPRLLRPSIQCPASERSRPLPHESHAAVAAKLGVQNQHRPSPERRRRDASLRKARLHRSPSRRRRLLCNVCHLRASHLSPLRGIRWSEANAGTCSSYLVRFATRVLEEVTQRR